MRWIVALAAVLSISAVGCSNKSKPASSGVKSDTYVHQAVQGGGYTSSGICNAANVESVMGKYGSNLRGCFTSQVPNNPNFGGRVTLNFTIAQNGGVSNVSTSESTINHGGVEKCLRDVVAPLSFGKPNGGVCNVKWPLTFNVK